VTGSAAIGSDMLLSSGESIRNTEMTTICLVVLILLLVYRAPGLVIIPLLAIVVAFIVATNGLPCWRSGASRATPTTLRFVSRRLTACVFKSSQIPKAAATRAARV